MIMTITSDPARKPRNIELSCVTGALAEKILLRNKTAVLELLVLLFTGGGGRVAIYRKLAGLPGHQPGFHQGFQRVLAEKAAQQQAVVGDALAALLVLAANVSQDMRRFTGDAVQKLADNPAAG